MNKAINQVIMHEQIGGNKQAPSQPIGPVKMPEAPVPAGSPPKRITGVNVPPPKRPIPFPFPGDTTKEIQPKPIRPGSQPRPIPASGGAEVTPPEGLPESMKAFWKQRIGNQLIERKQVVPTVIKLAKWAIPGIVAGEGATPMMPMAFDPWGLIPDPFVGPGGVGAGYDEMNPNGYPYNNQGHPEMPAGTQGTGQWAGPNVPGGGSVTV